MSLSPFLNSNERKVSMLNISRVKLTIILTCFLSLIFLVSCQGVPTSEEAYYFAHSASMLGFEPDKAKHFADAYNKRCNEVGRLNQQFYNAAYNVAYDHEMFSLDDEQSRKFVVDFALSCKPKSLITPASYKQAYEFAHNPYMMNLYDQEAKGFVYDYLLKCGRENYLTPNNWKRVYDYASSKLNMGVIDAENHTKKFFRECKAID